jgi:hypothetical protein
LCGVFSNRSMMEEPFFMTDQFQPPKFSESADSTALSENLLVSGGELQ